MIQQGELVGRLRLTQHGAGAHRQLDRRVETRFGERQAAGLAIHHADHPVRVGLGTAGAHLVEQLERFLRALARILEPLVCRVHFGVIHEAKGREVAIAAALGDGAAFPK